MLLQTNPIGFMLYLDSSENAKFLLWTHFYVEPAIYIFFSDSAYRKYLTATYSYDYGNGGGSDYDQI